MRFAGIITTLSIFVVASQSIRETAIISLQPITVHATKPFPLAKITIDPSTLDTELLSYETPDLSTLSSQNQPVQLKYFRVGIYDVVTSAWISSTTLTSKDTFAKGYSPSFVINFDTEGRVIGVSVKGYRIDAGLTRNFGPKFKVVQMKKGPKVHLNRPVASREGIIEEPSPQKTFLQKYWWMILAAMMVLMTARSDTE